MPFLFVAFFFMLGAVVGSFLNVLVDRIPIGENPFKGRSHCDYCKHKLSWYDLIPLISFLSLNGKCRYCHKRLSLNYPLVEAITGALFAFTVFSQGHNFNFQLVLYYLFTISALVVIFFTDLKYGIIPFNAVVFGILASLIYVFFNTYYLIPNFLLAGIGAFLAFLLLFLATRGRGIGFGDVVYVFLMGFILGFPKIIVGLYIAFVTGAVISLILIFLKKKKIKGGTIPFGPFLVGGTIITLFWGDFLMSWILPYLH